MEKIKTIELDAGFYKMKRSEAYMVSIPDGQEVTIFDDSVSENLDFSLGKGSVLHYYGFFINKGKKSVILKQYKSSDSDMNILNLVKDHKSSLEIKSFLEGDSSASKINILSVVGTDGDIRIDSNITVSKSTERCIADIRQDNVFIGETARISGIPGLSVHTDDAQASHSLKIEKIREEDIFYLTSRGIDKTSATAIMLQSKINALFSGYMENKDFLLEIFDNFIKE